MPPQPIAAGRSPRRSKESRAKIRKVVEVNKRETLTDATNLYHDRVKMNKVFEMIRNNNSTLKPVSFEKEGIFKAIQSRIVNSKKPKDKENATPKSGKKKQGRFTQRTSSLKGPIPGSGYSSAAFSPRGFNSTHKERDQICSPMTMKMMSKKKGSRNKNITKKRDLVGNLSRHFDNFTMHPLNGKPFHKSNNSIGKNTSRGHTKSSFIHSHKRSCSRTNEVYNNSGSRKRKSKKRTALLSKGLKSSSNISCIKKNKKAILKLLNQKSNQNKNHANDDTSSFITKPITYPKTVPKNICKKQPKGHPESSKTHRERPPLSFLAQLEQYKI